MPGADVVCRNMRRARAEMARRPAERGAAVRQVRFCPYPAEGNFVLACAELVGGDPDIEVLFELPATSSFDERALERFFVVPLR